MSRVCSFLAALFVVALALGSIGCSNSSSSSPISLSLTPSASQAIDQTQTVNFTATLRNDNSLKGIAWSLNGPGSLSSSTGTMVTYSSPTTAAFTSPQQVIVTAMSVADPSKRVAVQITVNPLPRITTLSLPNGRIGLAYSQQITLTGGTGPFKWSAYNGSFDNGHTLGAGVPDGLKIDPATGMISGTPTASGTWFFDAVATDATGEIAVAPFFSISIGPTTLAGNPIPFLDQLLVPAAVAPGASSFTLHLTGTGFISGATVNFNGTQLATTVMSPIHLTAIVPAASVANATTAAVTVTNPPLGTPSNIVYFQVAAPETTVSFAPAANSPLQIRSPYGIAVGDFNEDGKQDMAVPSTINIYVYTGNGDGTFAVATGSPIPAPYPAFNNLASPYTGPITIGDFDHSGHLGLAVGEFNNDAIFMLLGNGNGTFTPSSSVFTYTMGFPTSAVTPADFNQDGSLDLAITNEFTGQSPVVVGSGKGAFTNTGILSTGLFPIGIAIGDFNGDGKLDTVIPSGGTIVYPASGVTTSLGNGDGTFSHGSPVSVGQNLTAIVAADFNGDGKLDIAVTDYDANAVLVLLGNGDGTFAAPTSLPIGNQPVSIMSADFNNDGKLDLATANFGGNSVSLLLGNGDGTFTQASGSPYAVGNGPNQVVSGDFNGDGKLDLAVANLLGDTVSILLQQ